MKKTIAFALVAVMLLALVPMTAMAATAITIEDTVIVTNYNHVGFPYDPPTSNRATITINAPYDDIAKSSPPAGSFGANYMVQFLISNGQIDLSADTIRVNGRTIDNNSYNNGTVRVDPFTVICTFTAQRGGNRSTFNVQIYDNDIKTWVSRSVTVVYNDTGSSGGGSSSSTSYNMTADVYGSTATHNIWTSNGVIFIEYDGSRRSFGSLLDATLYFQDRSGDRIPYRGTASLSRVTSNGQSSFLFSTSGDRSFSDTLLGLIYLDPTNTRVTFRVTWEGVVYESQEYVVVWRDTTQNTSSGSLTISPSRTPSITVGQEYTFSIFSNNIYNTGNYFTLDVGGNAGVVTTATGKYLTIRGVSPGTTWLNVRNASGTILDTIAVTVTASGGVGIVPPIAYLGTYRVTANSLNVRSGPGTGFPIVGNVRLGTQVTVNSISGGWANIAWGIGSSAYVSTSFITHVSGPVTTFEPTTNWSASSGTGLSTGTTSTTTSGGRLGGNATSSFADYDRYMEVGVNWTSVMSGPGRNYEVIADANLGDVVLVYGVVDGWAYVNWEGRVAYILLSHLD